MCGGGGTKRPTGGEGCAHSKVPPPRTHESGRVITARIHVAAAFTSSCEECEKGKETPNHPRCRVAQRLRVKVGSPPDAASTKRNLRRGGGGGRALNTFRRLSSTLFCLWRVTYFGHLTKRLTSLLGGMSLPTEKFLGRATRRGLVSSSTTAFFATALTFPIVFGS